MDAATQQEITLTSPELGGRFQRHDFLHPTNPLLSFTYYTIDFTGGPAGNWNTPVIIEVIARDDPDNEDPFTAVIRFDRDDLQWVAGDPNEFNCLPANPTSIDDVADVDYRGCDIDGGATVDVGETYVFPNLRSGTGIVAATVIDNETADLITIETDTDTVVQKCGNPDCTVPDPVGDEFDIRLTKQPSVLNNPAATPVVVNVAILMDGLADVVSIDGNPTPVSSYEIIGGDVPSLRFQGNVVVAALGAKFTITRANGSELGSFFEEGFQVGQRLTTSFTGAAIFRIVNDGLEAGVTDDRLIVELLSGPAPTAGAQTGARISTLTRSGIWDGQATVQAPEQDAFGNWEGWTLVRTTGGWLADGFLEGQWVEIRQGAVVIRGEDPGDPRDEPDVRQPARVEVHAGSARPDGPGAGTDLLRRSVSVRQRPVLRHPDRCRRPLRRHRLVPAPDRQARRRRPLRRADRP